MIPCMVETPTPELVVYEVSMIVVFTVVNYKDHVYVLDYSKTW